MKYLIDTNCFIEPHRGYSPLDVAYSLWNKLISLAQSNEIFVLDKVKSELDANSDELSKWINLSFPSANIVQFDSAEGSVLNFRKLVIWANSQNGRKDSAKSKFTNANKADIYLVSYAMTNPENWTVVSMERSNNNGSSDFKLPDVCTSFGVKCIRLEDMFRELNQVY